MLKPPVQIFVAYGHNHKLRDDVAEALNKLAEQLGFRIRVKVVTDSIVRTGTGSVGSEVHKTLRSVDAAIILLSSDDYAISQVEFERIRKASVEVGLIADELVKQMERRARQNVVYEIGYLHAKIGQERYYIIEDEDMSAFSNLGDVFRTKRKNFEGNLEPLLKEFLVERLKLKTEHKPLRDSVRQIEYDDFIEESKSLDDTEILRDFEREFSALQNEDDRILYIYERIVFDSYFQVAVWWKKQIAQIKSREPVHRSLVSGLNLVQEYIANWRPPERKDYGVICFTARELAKVVKDIEPLNIAPIVRIVLYDYLALALDKCARKSVEVGLITESRVNWLKAVSALDNVIRLSNEYEDEHLPLWRGYAAYNKARVLRQLSDHDVSSGTEWIGAFQEAIRFRHKWTETQVSLPKMVKEGLFAEYLHAKATRIEMRQEKELGEYAIKDEFIVEARKEFKDWLAGPDQKRVRLAQNVIETWKKIDKSTPTPEG